MTECTQAWFDNPVRRRRRVEARFEGGDLTSDGGVLLLQQADRRWFEQIGRFFLSYYDHYCFLPLYLFFGRQLLVSYLRLSKTDGVKHAWAILSLLVKRLRQTWPNVRLQLRAAGSASGPVANGPGN